MLSMKKNCSFSQAPGYGRQAMTVDIFHSKLKFVFMEMEIKPIMVLPVNLLGVSRKNRPAYSNYV